MSDLKRETVNIHGKEYETVASRVARMRADHPDWSIVTEMLRFEPELVIVRAAIATPVGDRDMRVIGTGHASEVPGDGNINRTSPLENCETSAIGRALSACGYQGTEYASANEMDKVSRGPQHGGQDTQKPKTKAPERTPRDDKEWAKPSQQSGKCPECNAPAGKHGSSCSKKGKS